MRSVSTVQKILEAAKLNSDSLVVEIGPGEGVLTEGLAKAARRVHAFEIDPELAARLAARLPENVSVHEGDFLRQDPAESLGSDGESPVIVVANLPYYITAPILERLFWKRPLVIERAVLMMQHEVAARVTGVASREAGALTYIVGAHFRSNYLFKVPPTSFAPPPKVDSAVIELIPNGSLDHRLERLYETLVSTAFRARRKQLGRSLRSLNPDAPAILTSAGIDFQRRPETLSVQEFCELARKWPRE